MGRLKRRNLKIGAAIFIFSLVLTVAFVGALIWFGLSANQEGITKNSIYPISKTEYSELIDNGGTLQINAEKLIGSKNYQSAYLHRVLSILIPISGVFLILLISLSLCLWLVLKKIQNNENFKIVNALNTTMTDNVISDNPALSSTYAHLRQKFDNSLNDYKRLNSYLSHEQKNELAILRTNLELSENREYLKNIDYIADSIDDILTLSENIEMTALSVVDVSLICAEVCDNYRKISDKITFEFDENEDTEILAKGRWIYRAVANLLDNAIKYGENRPIYLSVKAQKGSVVITVQDNGIGMSLEKQEKIFNHRYRINELNRDGYGIGLSLVSHVCDLCGGFILAESKPDNGSVFYLSFPQKLF